MNINRDDELYARIVNDLEWETAAKHIDQLRDLAASGHPESMNLLAVILGDVDADRYREEIIDLYERAHELGSPVAAKGLSIQYRQWNEIDLSRMWEFRARGRGAR